MREKRSENLIYSFGEFLAKDCIDDFFKKNTLPQKLQNFLPPITHLWLWPKKTPTKKAHKMACFRGLVQNYLFVQRSLIWGAAFKLWGD